jgi:carnitine-CoA ligase
MYEYPMRERVFGRIFADKARRLGDKTFLKFEDRRVSYAEAEAISNRVANGLAGLGIGHGQHVAVYMNNCPEQLWLFFALCKLGACVVPINTAAKGELLLYYLEQSDATSFIVERSLAERWLEVQDRAAKVRQAVLLDETGPAPAALAERFKVPVSDYWELERADGRPPEVAVKPSDLSFLSYTSGTTGPSKGNMATHAHMLTCGIEAARLYGYTPDDVIFTCLPLFHGNAWLVSCLPAIAAEATLAVSRWFSASRFWDEARAYGATQFNALGAMINMIWAQPARPDDADNPVRQCMCVPTPKEIYRDFEQRFDLKLTTLYALTDFGLVTFKGVGAPAEKWASAGRVRPEVELRIVDDDDFEVPAGEPGEIVLRAREPWFAPRGYYNMPEATIAAWRNLWFHTGDRGRLDADGWLTFVDRKKDAIRRRGENISSYEVEQMVMRHQAVAEAAAYAVPSEMSEDEVMVSVVLRPGASLSEADLVAFCVANMAYYMVPRYVEFRDDLPRTMSEKVQKYKLKAEAVARLAEIWDREKAGIEVKR